MTNDDDEDASRLYTLVDESVCVSTHLQFFGLNDMTKLILMH